MYTEACSGILDRHVIRAETSIKLDNEIKEILTLKSQNFPIFIGGELSPSSAHRKFYEAGENLASIGCYPDDARAIRQIIIQKASSANLKISSDAIAFLVNTLQGDRLLINNELDKLFLYKDGAQSIELEDCIQSVSESMESNPDLLCIGYGSRNAKLYLKELDNLLENGINEIWILRALARYYLNLLKVKLLLKDGMPLENAMRELKPPIFFKYVDSFKDIVSRLMLDEIKSSLESFTKAEIDFKSGSGSAVLDRVFLHRFG